MIDTAIIAFYFIVVLWIGMRSGRKIQNIQEFSIGKRNFSVTVLVATLSGTLIGGGTTFGLAEKVFASGLIFLVAYCGILVERVFTAVVVADKMEPFFGLITAGDIMEKIYGKPAKVLTGIGTITTSIFILGAHITTMGFILKMFLGMPLPLSLALSTISILIYSGYGGIAAVSFTDVVQFAFMLVSIPLVALISLMDIGGFQAIISAVPKSHLYLNNVDRESLWQHGAIFLSYSLPALYPVIIQRMLMARSTKQIKVSLWLNAILSLFFFLMIALIGLVAFVKNPQLDPKQAFPSLILNSLPSGILGLVIVGLLATVMSTVDSFLNLIGVSFTHDVLKPLIKFELTAKQQLAIARFVTVFIGLAGLVSALYFNGILENVFASMNLWLPFIFPPLFFGIMRNHGSQTSFLMGVASAAAMLILAKMLELGDGFFSTILAASANSLALLITSRRHQNQPAPGHLSQIQQKVATALYSIYQELRSTLTSNLAISDILSVFILSCTTLPIIASAGAGARPTTVSIILGFSIAIVAVFFILKDLWIEKTHIRHLSGYLPLFIATSQITQPLINFSTNGISPLSIINLLIGIVLLWILLPGVSGIFWGAAGSLIAMLLMKSFIQAEPAYGAIPQTMEVTLRLIAMIYFVLYFRKQDRYRLEKFNSLTGVLAHEVSHSIVSMNFCAHRLSLALPALIDAYRNDQPKAGIDEAISHNDLIALEELADRLKENANRTKSTMRTIQTKILNDSTSMEKVETSVRALVQEAINSGIKESLNSNAQLEFTGEDFKIIADKGLVVHVFINLLKNSLEALQETAHPRIEIAVCREQNSVRIIDNGCGISPSLLERIFDENFTTKKTGKGKGLHFCRMILNELGASITCVSISGKTEFIISFKGEFI